MSGNPDILIVSQPKLGLKHVHPVSQSFSVQTKHFVKGPGNYWESNRLDVVSIDVIMIFFAAWCCNGKRSTRSEVHVDHRSRYSFWHKRYQKYCIVLTIIINKLQADVRIVPGDLDGH